MPHFGLMDASKMDAADAALLRARLHIRGGQRRFRQGKFAAGLASLYDALIHGMRWYILSPEHQKQLGISNVAQLRDDRDVFAVLSKAGVVGNLQEFDELYALTEKALDDQSFPFDAPAVLTQIEKMMTQLGVMPFNESALPPENPATL